MPSSCAIQNGKLIMSGAKSIWIALLTTGLFLDEMDLDWLTDERIANAQQKRRKLPRSINWCWRTYVEWQSLVFES